MSWPGNRRRSAAFAGLAALTMSAGCGRDDRAKVPTAETTISGVVKDEQGRPLAEWPVQGCTSKVCINAATDENGRFAISGIDAPAAVAVKTRESDATTPWRAESIAPVSLVKAGPADAGTLYVPTLPPVATLAAGAETETLAVGDGLQLSVRRADLRMPAGASRDDQLAARSIALPRVPALPALGHEVVIAAYAFYPFGARSTTKVAVRLPTSLAAGTRARLRTINEIDGTLSPPETAVSDGRFLVSTAGAGIVELTWLIVSMAPEGQAVWFTDVTAAAGLTFVHDAGPSAEKYFFPAVVGSGAALFDFDGDGRLDLYLINNGGPNGRPNRLFRQATDGRFVDVSAGSGLDVSGWGMGVAVGDVNNDGAPDVLLTEYGRARLFLNRHGVFRDVSKEAGLDNPHWGTSAAFLDYDRDGRLDIVIANYVTYDPTKPCGGVVGRVDFCGPHAFPGTVARLFRNRGGTPVRFEDTTLASGLGTAPGAGLGVVPADLNGDGWPDLLIANDGEDNHLWINRHDGTFRQEALLRGIAYDALGRSLGNMGIATGDVDGDGLNDVFITHLPDELPVLWKQGPSGQFRDVTVASGVSRARWRGTGFGTVFADFDLDGDLDLAVANGAVHNGGRLPVPGEPFWDRFKERNQLFVNDGRGNFQDLSLENDPFCKTPMVSRGLVVGDLDNDGALDVVVTAIGAPARLFRNVAPRLGHWLMVRAIDPKLGGRDAYGAEISITAGGRHWTRYANPGYSYASSNDPRVHFGLGPIDRVESLTIAWPDGVVESFGPQPVDRLIVIRKGDRTTSHRSPSP